MSNAGDPSRLPPALASLFSRALADPSVGLKHVRAIDNLIVAGRHLESWLKADHPPFDVSLAVGLKHYGGSSAAFDLWVGWRAIKVLEIEWVSAPAPVGPSEPADGTVRQPRLGRT